MIFRVPDQGLRPVLDLQELRYCALRNKRVQVATPQKSDTRLILVVDDDRRYRAFVSDVLQRAGFETREASTGQAAISSVREERPAAVLLDVILPGATGYEICRELKDEHGPELPIVFVTGERTEAADKVAGILVGGDDYIVKPFDPDELIVRVRRLIDRSPSRTQSMPRADSPAQLTRRETEVLRLLAQGLSAGDIARELVISSNTVATHIQRILGKLGVHSRTQAVALAYELGLVGTILSQ
jgi:two-component system, NarL family, nitrate/nitrite response regulator NarL